LNNASNDVPLSRGASLLEVLTEGQEFSAVMFSSQHSKF
jgi:hypothetical protein